MRTTHRSETDTTKHQQRVNQARYARVLAASQGDKDSIEILKDAQWFYGAITPRSSDAHIISEAKRTLHIYAGLAGVAAPAPTTTKPTPTSSKSTNELRQSWDKAVAKANRKGQHATSPATKGARR